MNVRLIYVTAFAIDYETKAVIFPQNENITATIISNTLTKQ